MLLMCAQQQINTQWTFLYEATAVVPSEPRLLVDPAVPGKHAAGPVPQQRLAAPARLDVGGGGGGAARQPGPAPTAPNPA